MASVPVVDANPRLALAVVVGRPHDERGVAAGDTDAFRALRLDAAPQVPGPTRRPGEGMRSFSAGAGTGALVTGVVGDREGGPA
jgi:hypothetical protein